MYPAIDDGLRRLVRQIQVAVELAYRARDYFTVVIDAHLGAGNRLADLALAKNPLARGCDDAEFGLPPELIDRQADGQIPFQQ